MSQFDDELKNILKKVDGAKAAVLMGFDGISVAEVNELSGQLPLQDVVVEYGRVLLDSMKIAQGNDLGAISELTFSTSDYKFILRVLDTQYYVGLFLLPDGNVGKGRYVLRQATSSIKSLL